MQNFVKLLLEKDPSLLYLPTPTSILQSLWIQPACCLHNAPPYSVLRFLVAQGVDPRAIDQVPQVNFARL